jgi:cytochrome c551/c552
MKKLMISLSLILSAAILTISCGGNNSGQDEAAASTTEATATNPKDNESSANPSYDPKRGEGKFHDVKLGEKLDASMAAKGEKVYELKCASCHKLSDEKLVGPGWKGVTSRHEPEWILNFVTNTDEMLDKDPKAQAMLEICMVRMPNQNLSDDDAKSVLEFMRKNDGVK